MLRLWPNCESCKKPLPADSRDARICSYECTFCSTCSRRFNEQCPNCQGALEVRPARSAETAICAHRLDEQCGCLADRFELDRPAGIL